MAMDGSGNFLVAWQQDDGDGDGISGRLFDAAGVAQAQQFQINTYSTAQQSSPSVARNAAGDFVVAWQSDQDGDGFGIYAQRYDEGGAPLGSEFRVNTYTTDSQTSPSVAMNEDGGFVIVWQSANQDGSGYGVFGQRYDPSGAPEGPEFQVSTYTTNDQKMARVAAFPSGGFVVVWAGFGHSGLTIGVFGRRYDSSGVAQGRSSWSPLWAPTRDRTSRQVVPAILSSPGTGVAPASDSTLPAVGWDRHSGRRRGRPPTSTRQSPTSPTGKSR